MAKEHSMDISVEFDFQELRNAVEQTKKEVSVRFDLKDAGIVVELEQEAIKVTAQSDMQVEAVYGVLVKKMISRGVSPKILDRQKTAEIGGMKVRQEMKLIAALDQETAKMLSKKIREAFPKVKPVIQGETVRVTAAKIDDLQGVMAMLKGDEKIEVPLNFGNYR